MFEHPQYIPAGDARLCVYTWGTGAPLVLLHGNGEDSTYFRDCIPYLSRFYRVIAVDSRGHGRSERGGEPLTFARMAEDLACVFDALGVLRASLLGFSDGGNLALRFALTYPQAVDRLILNGANVTADGVQPWVQLPLYPAVGLLLLAAPFDARLRGKRDVLALMTRDQGLSLADLSGLRLPVLVIVGDRDMIRPSHTRAIARALPAAQMAVLPGSHFVAAERPARFCLNCLSFLRGQPVPDRVRFAAVCKKDACY